MPYYIFSIVALAIHILINFETFFKKDSASSIGSYRVFLVSVAIFYISDILWGIFYDLALRIPLIIDAYLYFICMGTTVFFWTLFIIKYVRGSKITNNLLKIFSFGLLISEFVLLIINMFNPIFFNIESNSTFTPLPARTVIFILQIGMYLSIAIYSMIYTIRIKDKEFRRYITILVYSIINIICIGLQLYFPLIPFYPIGCLIGTCIIDTYALNDYKEKFKVAFNETNAKYQKNKKMLNEALEIATIDPLTGIKNKYAYIETIERFDKLINEGLVDYFAVLVFDINGLKLINDTYGHAAGDNHIIESVKLIEKFFPHDTIYRFGGDEFVVIITDELEDVNNNYDSFINEVEDNLKTDKPVVSCGLSLFNKLVDNSFRAVFSRADNIMYERKIRLKNIK